MDSIDTLTLGIFLGILLIVGIIIAVISMEGDRKFKARLARIEMRWSGKGGTNASSSVSRIALDTSTTSLDKLIRQIIPRPAELRKRLQQTGKDIAFGKYVGFSLAMCVAAFIVSYFMVGYGVGTAAALSVLLGVGVPHWVVGVMIAKRLKRFTKLFPDAIDLMVRGLKSGLPITESISAAAREIEDPVGSEFRKIIDAIRLGQTLDEALWVTTTRIATAEFKFFVISLSIQQETGGNLAETLQNLSDILRKREQMKLKIKAMSSEARASALIIGSLPFIMAIVLSLVNYGYISQLWNDPRGLTMLAAGLGLIGTGCFVIAKMVRFEI